MHTVNEPLCIRNEDAYYEDSAEGCQHYVFAAMLPPGPHQLVIYDPLLNRAYCQEFIIEHEAHLVMYPELMAPID